MTDTKSDVDGQGPLPGIPKVESITVNQGFLPDGIVYGIDRWWQRRKTRNATATN